MAKRPTAIPEGFHTLTPGLVVHDATQAIEFYKKAFGAEEISRMTGPGGKGIMHAELRIGNSVIFLGDESPDMGALSPRTLKGSPVSLHLYVEDVDAAFKRALGAGAAVKMPVSDMFWGDRYGKVTDPFGHQWGLATHKEDVTPQEMERRAKDFLAQTTKPKHS